MKNIELSYDPITSTPPEITVQEHDNYLMQGGRGELAIAIAFSPLEETLKQIDKELFEFGGIKIKRAMKTTNSKSWKPVAEGLAEFLRIRADDARAGKMPELKFVEGVGYCISPQALIAEIQGRIVENTSTSSNPSLTWPKDKVFVPVRRIELPDRDYSKPALETVRLALDAKRFAKSIETELIEPFKDAQKLWLRQETGFWYDEKDEKSNIPPQDNRFISRVRQIGPGRYVFSSLGRVEEPDYKGIIEELQRVLTVIQEGQAVEGYRVSRQHPEGCFINIKSVSERVSDMMIKERKVTGRYKVNS